MYILDDMVDEGLPFGVKWPTKTHRIIAQNILLQNPSINSIDKLQRGVINILNIPTQQIQDITFHDLSKYGFNISIGVSV